MKNHRDTSPALTTGGLLDRGRGLFGLVAGDPAAPISAVEYNSSRAGKGALFVAVAGYSSDGHRYGKDAVDRGAAAVVVSMARAAEFAPLAQAGVTVLGAENTAIDSFSLTGNLGADGAGSADGGGNAVVGA